jgi:hypothetical protein
MLPIEKGKARSRWRIAAVSLVQSQKRSIRIERFLQKLVCVLATATVLVWFVSSGRQHGRRDHPKVVQSQVGASSRCAWRGGDACDRDGHHFAPTHTFHPRSRLSIFYKNTNSCFNRHTYHQHIWILFIFSTHHAIIFLPD